MDSDGSARAGRLSRFKPSLALINMAIAAGTLLVTAYGLFSIFRQIEQSQATLISEISDKAYARMHDIHKLLIEEPELRPYFYEGKENVKPETQEGPAFERYQQVAQMAEVLCDFFHQVILSLDTVPKQDQLEKAEMYDDLRYGWTCYIKDVFKRSPALRQHYVANKPWYTSNKLATTIFDEAESERLGKAPVAKQCQLPAGE